MTVTGPKTGFSVTDPNTGNTQDLGSRYISKDYLIDVYPNIVPGRTTPGLWAWGYDAYGQLGSNTQIHYSSSIQIGSLTNWKWISCGNYITTAVKTDGTLWSWGYNQYGQLGNNNQMFYMSPVQVGTLSNWKLIAAGNQHTVGIQDGYL